MKKIRLVFVLTVLLGILMLVA